MAVKVKMKLNRVQWSVLADLLEKTTLLCPVEDWNLESYVIATMYVSKMAFWKIFPYGKGGKVKVSLTMVQAIAINNLFGATDDRYNALIRMHLEPQLILNVHTLQIPNHL